MATKTRRVPVPMGFHERYDPDAPLVVNARRAWECALANIRHQHEQGLNLKLRRAFGLTDLPEVVYYARHPRIPVVEIEEELVGFEAGSACLIERCSDCGEGLRRRNFDSLSGFGQVLDERDHDDDFVCGDCNYKAATTRSRRGRK